MALTINVNNNISAINVRRHLGLNGKDLGTRLERLSSGMRINRASDDAAGLSISEGFRAQITGLTQGVRNAEMGSNMLQVAEGSLNEVSAMLIRMRELAVESANSTVNDQNREAIEAEIIQLRQEIDRIALSTVYNDQTLLTGYGNRAAEALSTAITASATTGVLRVTVSGAPSGTYTFTDGAADGAVSLGNGVVSQTIRISSLLDGNNVATGTTVVANFDRLGLQVTLAGHGVSTATGSYVDGDLNARTVVVEGGTGGSFQVGADDVAEDRLEVGIGDLRASSSFLNLNSVSLATRQSARESITKLDLSIQRIAQQRGDIGSVLNRLRYTLNFTESSIEGNTDSESTIRDADMAQEVTAYSRIQVLSQAATAMLAQANTSPQRALTLLQA
jgi:flagellin